MAIVNRIDVVELLGMGSILIFVISLFAVALSLNFPTFWVSLPFAIIDNKFWFFLLLITGVLIYVHSVLRNDLYLKSIESALRFPEKNSHYPHHAIVFPHYEKSSKETYMEDLVFLLIQKIRENNLPYKVYHIWNFSDFMNMYENINTVHLWLLGHGRRGAIKTCNCLIKYSDFENLNVKSKDSIHQLHCNSGSDKSLIEVNKPKKGEELHLIGNIFKLNMAINVRKYIERYFDDPNNFTNGTISE